MNKVKLIFFVFYACYTTLSANTLKESVLEALNTNPVVQERLRNFRAVQQELNIAKSAYYPTLDLRANVSVNKAGAINSNITPLDYNAYETSLVLAQNLFNGFSTLHSVDSEKANSLSAAYSYVEKLNETAFEMVQAYLKVLQSYELLQTAKENVEINEVIYKEVKSLYDSGLTTDSEVKKIQSILSLAKSNMTIQRYEVYDREYKYRKILGRMPEISQMKRPKIDVRMPENMQVTALYSIKNNPSLLMGKYKIQSAQARYKERKKEYYPRVDLELTQNYNKPSVVPNGFTTQDDRFTAKILMNYNLFRGGADVSGVQKYVSILNQERYNKQIAKREIVEKLNLAWDSNEMIKAQLVDLREYSTFSEKTLSLYQEEYELGRRSLLDLLSSQNDVINSRAKIISAEYTQLLSQYKILDIMGVLISVVTKKRSEFTSLVNIDVEDDSREILDSVDANEDEDKDRVKESEDLCDNSYYKNFIDRFGCVEAKKRDITNKNYTKEDEMNLIFDIKTSNCPKVPYGRVTDEDSCSYTVELENEFSNGGVELGLNAEYQINSLVKFLNKHPTYRAHVIGHTSSKGEYGQNLSLSKERAEAVKKSFLNFGALGSVVTTEGRGGNEPISDNNTSQGRSLNQRVEIEIIRETFDE